MAGRYRLVDQTSVGTGWAFWKATDEPLARSVTVLTFAPGFPRITEAITAARAASRLGDPRFSQVFDVEDISELAYVVLEWVAGQSLLDMLADGPLDAPLAASLLCEAAQAIAAAHAGGLAHLRLNPACLHWTRGSGVKITGLGIDAVLAGLPPATAGNGPGDGENPELTDTRDLARLLYAALTGYWPGSPEPAEPGDAAEPADPRSADPRGADTLRADPLGRAGLPAAPQADGVPLTPRQVSAAVPASIDALTCQALFQRPSRHGPALSTAAMLAEALAHVAPPDPLPPPAAATASLRAPADHNYRPNGPTNPFPVAGPATRPRSGAPHRRSSPDRSSTRAVIVSAVVVVVLVAAGVVGWVLNHRGSPGTATPPTNSPSSSSAPSAAASVVLTPVSANSFDALGDNGGNEDGSGAKNAIDNNPSTFWHTDYYYTYPALGNLKKGTGLILDMGKQVRLSQVVVQFGDSCCTDVEIEIGNNNTPVPSALSSFTEVASSTTAHGSTTFNVSSTTTGRYVLIWITRLPPLAGTGNQYEAQIYNVVVHGSAPSRSG
ncbi:MAG TPA: discoidin domain-containing protein [Streptosporangiaceae bacterium]|nr:discoidin domain-containing protein [Streptosporangiaceae bacterium]